MLFTVNGQSRSRVADVMVGGKLEDPKQLIPAKLVSVFMFSFSHFLFLACKHVTTRAPTTMILSTTITPAT